MVPRWWWPWPSLWMGLLCVVCHEGGGCICNLGLCALWHFRNLKEGSQCRCRNKIKTIGEKKRKERNCIEGQYRKKKKKNKLWASRRRICGANISKVKKSEGGWLGRASINLKKLPSEGWIWVSEGGWTISSSIKRTLVVGLGLNEHNGWHWREPPSQACFECWTAFPAGMIAGIWCRNFQYLT